MNIYVCDASDGRTKSWPHLVGDRFQHIKWLEIGDSTFISASDKKRIVFADGVLVLHGPTSHDESIIKAVIKVLDACPRMCGVVVSGGGLAVEKPHEKLYFRRTPVEKEDVVFAKQFKDFVAQVEHSVGNSPNFDLLEPTAVPEPILAYAIAVHYGFGEWKLKALRSAADDAYRQLYPYVLTLLPSKRGALIFADVGLPKADEFEREPSAQNEAVSKRFKAMRNVIDILREDL